jgi:hypothetical protein
VPPDAPEPLEALEPEDELVLVDCSAPPVSATCADPRAGATPKARDIATVMACFFIRSTFVFDCHLKIVNTIRNRYSSRRHSLN